MLVRTNFSKQWLFLALLALPIMVFAHTEGGADASNGFFTGMMHPVTGLDHVIAMVAVGLWGAQLGMPALWVLPVAFPMIMALGGAMGAIGIGLPGVEIGIALSGVVLGAMVLLNIRMPLWAALIPVSIFAVFHGHAHGTEMPEFSQPLLYAAGFVIATGLLHICGIAIGWLWNWPMGQWIVRGAGVVIGSLGAYFLFA